MDWIDEITLISEVSGENRVNKNGFAVKPEESARTVFCNKKSVGYRVLRNTGKDLEKDKTECLISYSQSGCPAVRQREKIRLLVSSYGERQELNT